MRNYMFFLNFALVGLLALALAAPPAHAQVGPPEVEARAWLLLDASTGQVLAERDADRRFEPASLTKLMTAYLVFGAIKEGRLKLDQRPPVSQVAYKAIGSRMFVDPRAPATVDELLHGMIIQSGNDASVILAEALGGSEQTFAEMMNREAQRLGLKNTQFRNATGLPDPEHYASARDLATLALALIRDFPDRYRLYSEKEYKYNNIRQPNRNRLLFADPTVDGVKTGHTDAAGYCLIASARRPQPGLDAPRRLLSVVLGTASMSARAIESQKLLNWGFANTDAVRVYAKGQESGRYRVWKGAAESVPAGFADAVMVTVPKGQGSRLRAEIERVEPLLAPITSGQRIGTLRVMLDDKRIAEHALVAKAEVAPAGWFGRLWDSVRLLVTKGK